MWTEGNDPNTLRVDANFFKNGKKNPRFQIYPDTCGQGLRATGPDNIAAVVEQNSC